MIGPEITDVLTLGNGRTITGVTLAFDEALDPATAGSAANYTLFIPNRNGRGETAVPIQSATFDPSNNTVTVATARTLPLNTFIRVVVNGASSSGVSDIYGNRLRGTDASNGQDFSASFARGSNLRYFDHDGNLVTLAMSQGGLMDLYRSADGEGQVLRLIGNGPRRTVLSGNVRRGSIGSDGVTTFQSIDGATSAGSTPPDHAQVLRRRGVGLHPRPQGQRAGRQRRLDGCPPATVHVAGHRLFARKLRIRRHH